MEPVAEPGQLAAETKERWLRVGTACVRVEDFYRDLADTGLEKKPLQVVSCIVCLAFLTACPTV